MKNFLLTKRVLDLDLKVKEADLYGEFQILKIKGFFKKFSNIKKMRI